MQDLRQPDAGVTSRAEGLGVVSDSTSVEWLRRRVDALGRLRFQLQKQVNEAEARAQRAEARARRAEACVAELERRLERERPDASSRNENGRAGITDRWHANGAPANGGSRARRALQTSLAVLMARNGAG